MSENITGAFQNVDRSDAEFLIHFLIDANSLPTVLAGFKSQLEMLEIGEGEQVLDVGCGIGERAAQMAELVGTTGRVVGTDISETMVDVSRQRYGNGGLPLEFHVADACHQPFPNESFDKIRTERVLMYVHDVPAAFQEFRRLLRDGGKLLAADFAWDSLIFGHNDAALTRKITQYVCDSFPNGRIGANLLRIFHDAGFREIQIRPLGYIAPLDFTRRVVSGILQDGVERNVFAQGEIDGWWSMLEHEERDGVFLSAYEGFMVAGTK